MARSACAKGEPHKSLAEPKGHWKTRRQRNAVRARVSVLEEQSRKQRKEYLPAINSNVRKLEAEAERLEKQLAMKPADFVVEPLKPAKTEARVAFLNSELVFGLA